MSNLAWLKITCMYNYYAGPYLGGGGGGAVVIAGIT